MFSPAQEVGGAEVERRGGQGGEGFYLHGPRWRGGPEGPVVVAVLGEEAELAGLRAGHLLPQAAEVLVQRDGVLPGAKGPGDGAAGEEDLIEAAEEGDGRALGHRLLRVHRHDVGNPQGVEGRGHALRVAGGHHGQAELRFRAPGGVEDAQELVVPEGSEVAALALKNQVAGGDLFGLVAVAQVVEDGEGRPVPAGQEGSHRVGLGHVGDEGGRGLNAPQGVGQFLQGPVHGHRVGGQRAADQEEDVRMV
jgi:hypothetical protein